MSSSNEQRSLLQELERVEDVLGRLLKRIAEVNNRLKPLEHSMRTDEFASSGSYIPGTSNGFVCILSALIKGDPLSNSIGLLRGSGLKLPGIIKGSDRSETKSTCDSILKIVEANLGGTSIDYIINLRWANLPSVVDGSKVVVIGKRFHVCNEEPMRKLQRRFNELGFKILEDVGEFGGGPLTYRLTELARKHGKITVLEITLSRNFAGNHDSVAKILEAITIL